ncbi:hypothetical protein SAMN04487972_102188 [Paracoccus halophilus]|uniref:Peptidoglycan-binding protein n=1 Tax=Paracoccus halophilus TaxID=376733 RepID=A0A099F9J0_9RHOB|nr:peptidoglycan-binding domain-containing protein [Paracoccus halophilus]KGJ06757.1 peptidoglycan-binding protein [Paracoccus halophilus]SFA41769.1 hypothetical protein SAMN04487972_102188 [Paracoccus halophilus]
MRRFAFIIGAALPLIAANSAMAEVVVIRIEAKRGSEAAEATAQGWRAQFPDVVTFPLADGWIGIALGPMPREAATARLSELKGQNRVPADSFLSAAAGRELMQIGPAGDDPAAEDSPTTQDAVPDGGAGSPSIFPSDATGAGSVTGMGATPATTPGAEDEPPPPVEPAAPAGFFIRISSTADRQQAEETLAEYRELLPEAGLWTLPNGRLVVALGPYDEAAAGAWLAAFKNARAIPRDAFVVPGAEIGESAIAGDTPQAGTLEGAGSQPMPPLEDVQRALRWAGRYDGAIDGKDGPATQAAIAQEILRQRASPDAALAMRDLIRRREAWRDEIGLTQLQDAHTGLALPAPMDRLQFDRSERALSIYGPKDGSGAALILFSQPGGQQEMLDLAGLVTALGWVPQPQRQVAQGSVVLDGRNQTHIGHAEGRVVDGRVQGFVLIWPIADAENQHRLSAEISDNLARFAPGAGETAPETPAIAPAVPGN